MKGQVYPVAEIERVSRKSENLASDLDDAIFVGILTRGKNLFTPTQELGSDNLVAAAVELKQLSSNSGRLSECQLRR